MHVERTRFERDVTQQDERVGRFEPHIVVPVHLLLVYRAREIEHLPRSVKVVFRLRLVLAIAIAIALSLASRLFLAFLARRIHLPGRLGEQVDGGIIITTIFILWITRER